MTSSKESGFETIGTAFDFVNLCCQACRVEMAQDQVFYESLPNGKENLSIYSDNDIETYRDVAELLLRKR